MAGVRPDNFSQINSN